MIKIIKELLYGFIDREQRHITTDKKEIKDSPKLPSATSAIRGTLCKSPIIMRLL